jgi:O-antigen/teichoic acid export membrane protein
MNVMFQTMRISIEKNRIPFLVYLVGVFLFGILQGPLRGALGDWLAFVVAISYLLLLRLIGFALVKLVEGRHRRSISEHNFQVENRNKRK